MDPVFAPAQAANTKRGSDRRGCLLKLVIVLTICIAIPALGLLYIERTHLAPNIPAYPRVDGGSSYPARWEMALFGEAFGGVQTRDTYQTVLEYYRTALAERGWEGWWYRDRDGYCYTLLIIENDPIRARVPPGTTSIAFKLRYAFYSELGKYAPPGCK